MKVSYHNKTFFFGQPKPLFVKFNIAKSYTLPNKNKWLPRSRNWCKNSNRSIDSRVANHAIFPCYHIYHTNVALSPLHRAHPHFSRNGARRGEQKKNRMASRAELPEAVCSAARAPSESLPPRDEIIGPVSREAARRAAISASRARFLSFFFPRAEISLFPGVRCKGYSYFYRDALCVASGFASWVL